MQSQRSKTQFPLMSTGAPGLHTLSGHHAVNAADITQNLRGLGFSPAQAFGIAQVGGLGVEGLENAFNRETTASKVGLNDTLNDLIANAIGSGTALLPKYARPAGEFIGSALAGGLSHLTPVATDLLLKRQGGGKVPHSKNKSKKAKKRAKTMGLPHYQTGGHVNVVGKTIDAIQGISPQTGAVTGVANQLGSFNPQIQAQTGAMQQTAGQLGQFNPLQGAAGSTLQGFIQSGNAVNVDPLVQAAQIRGQQQFGDFLNQSNESFGALGLGSSSARAAAQAREAGRLSGGIAATGLEAGVASQEAARQRQLQAYNPLLQGSGQQLSGLQSAGSLQGQAAGLNLQGQEATAANRLAGLQSAGQLHQGAAGLQLQGQLGKAGAFNQLSGNLIPPTVGVNQQAPAQPIQQAPAQPIFGMSRPRTSAATAGGGLGAQNFAGSGLNYGMGRAYAKGGRVDLGDYLGQLTFGQRFTRPDPIQRAPQMQQPQFFTPRQPIRQYRPGPRPTARPSGRGIGRMRAQDQAELLGRAAQSTLGTWGHGATSMDRRRATDLGRFMQFLGPQEVGAGTRTAGQGFAQLGSAAAGAASRQQSDALSALIAAIRGQGKQGGGVVQGPAVPPDQVPILAQGGEGVIPVNLMHQLENAKRPKQLAAVARKIQTLMNKEPQLNDKDIQRKQRGGKIATVMREFKAGTLKSSSGEAVKDRKQAIAIALSEARRSGEKMQAGGEVQKMQGGGSLDERPLASEYFRSIYGPLADFLTVGPLRRYTGEKLGELGEYTKEQLPFRFEGDIHPPGIDPLSPTAGIPTYPERAQYPLPTDEAGNVSLPAPPREFDTRGDAARRGELDIPAQPRGSISITRPDGSAIGPGGLRGGPATGGGKPGGFSMMGRPYEEGERERLEYERARGRSALLRTYAAQGPRGAVEKLAPLIGQAQQEEALALDQYNQAQERAAEQAANQLVAQTQLAQTAGGIEEQQLKSAAEVERARLQKEGQIGAAQAKNPLADLGLGGGGTDPSLVLPDLAQNVDDPQQLLTEFQNLVESGGLANIDDTPENRAFVTQIMQKLEAILPPEEYASLVARIQGQ